MPSVVFAAICQILNQRARKGAGMRIGLLQKTKLFLVGLLITWASASSAQPAWPDRPIKLVVAYSAGSTGDIVVRALIDQTRERLGQPLIVENRAGAGGNIAASAVVNAAPDGTTLLVGAANNFVINQFLYSNIGFDPVTALAPVIALVDVPAVLFVNAATPASSLADLVKLAKASGGKMNYASPGLGTPPHLASEAINQTTSMGMQHVPYRGSPFTIAALLANDVQLVLAGAGAGIEHVKAGKLRAIAVGSRARLPELPEVSTLAELGLGEIRASTWWAIAAPRATPQPIVEKIARAFAESIALPAMQEKLREMGTLPLGGSTSDLELLIRNDLKYWQAALPSLRIKIQ